jgi:hypothetical protein
MWATLLVMFGVPHLASVASQAYDYPSTIMDEASLFVTLFNIVYSVSRILLICFVWRSSHPLKVATGKVDVELLTTKDRRTMGILLASLIVAVTALAVVAIKEFGSILKSSWGGFYAIPDTLYEIQLNSGLIKTIAVHLVFAGGGVIVAFLLVGKRTMAMIAAALPICYALITRNKIGVLPTFVSLIWWYLSRQKRIRVKQIIFIFIAGVLIVYSVYGLQVYRYAGSGLDFLQHHDLTSFNKQVIEMIFGGRGELALRDAFYRFLNADNQFPGFGEGRTYLRLLLMLIPTRFSFGLKPPDFAITMGSAYIGDLNNTTYSMHPTLYGDCYANGSWYGVLYGAFWALAVAIGDRAVKTGGLINRISLIVLLGSVYVIIARGSVYNGYFLCMVAWMFLWFLRIVVRGN